MARVVVGMSGGVDSSLSAALVREAGHEVVGVTLKLWPCAEEDGGFTREDACCSPTETIDARAVAQRTGVKHYVIDHEAEFRAGVVDDFLAGYARGETPNPCVRCNETVKFGSLWHHAKSLGAERVATGHYARVEQVFDRHVLRCAVDRTKDQTYFLFSLTQEQLAHAEFPVGHLTKDQVRDESRRRGLATADKQESQDICFIGGGGISEFLRREIPHAFRSGEIRHVDGTQLGKHDGLGAYTIGQRKGLGIAWSEPLHVVRLDTDTNTVWVAERAALFTDHITVRDCMWHIESPSAAGIACRVRLRHRGAPVAATVIPDATIPAREGRIGARIRFADPVIRPSAGQAAVFYDDAIEYCLGGGWIC